jgi:predicted amidophosphoribosyltransferase
MGQYECSVCGHDVAPGANYCEKCGARLNWTEHLPFAPDDEKNVKQSYPAQQRIILQRERPYYEVASQKELIGTFRKIAIGF